MSNLATAQYIIALESIPDAQKIEKATILGWECIVAKGEFRIGDLVCYICIDSVIPDMPQFAFMAQRKFRVRTIKLRGQISQGLVVPLPPGKWKEGDDLTDVLGVKKYEKDLPPDPLPKKPKIWYKKLWYIFQYKYLYRWFPQLRNKSRLRFPKSIPQTDETRIQNIPWIVEGYKDQEFVVSEKLDGSSITIVHEKKLFGQSLYRICSRRFELLDKQNEWYQAFVDSNFKTYIDNLVWFYGTNDVAVQGELIGKRQGNPYKLAKDEIRLFNIYVRGKRIDQKSFYEVCNSLHIPVCPFLRMDTVSDLPKMISEAEGKSVLNPETEREGVVWRNPRDNFSFKVVSNKFLLKNDE